MNKELPEHIYLKNDIDKAFNRGFLTAIDVFETSLGLSIYSQKYILDRLKQTLIDDEAVAVAGQHRERVSDCL